MQNKHQKKHNVRVNVEFLNWQIKHSVTNKTAGDHKPTPCCLRERAEYIQIGDAEGKILVVGLTDTTTLGPSIHRQKLKFKKEKQRL